MCLVSYVPTGDGFVFSSNRDEAPHRHATILTEENINNKKVYYPKDTKGGSWIFFSNKGDIICLLNGAHEIHNPHPPYKMSRGIMLKSFFGYDGPIEFIRGFEFDRIEPFTCIILTKSHFLEFIWDGRVKYVTTLNRDQDYNWSSCTLYTPEIQKIRNREFKKILSVIDYPDWDDVKSIHLNEDVLDSGNTFKMYRGNIVQTISLSQISCQLDSYQFRYVDILDKKPTVQFDYI